MSCRKSGAPDVIKLSHPEPLMHIPTRLRPADGVARTLFKGGEFRDYVEARLMELGVEEGIVDLDPRRTRG